MSETKDEIEDFTRPVPDGEITPEHRAWMNEQIRQTLAKKERGEMTYTPLDEVRRRFGLDES